MKHTDQAKKNWIGKEQNCIGSGASEILRGVTSINQDLRLLNKFEIEFEWLNVEWWGGFKSCGSKLFHNFLRGVANWVPLPLTGGFECIFFDF